MAARFVLFGPPIPIVPPPWQTKDDRVRGGASQSYLSPVEGTTSARFHGHLDTSTLGGAGFASQFSPLDAPLYKRSEEKDGQPQTREDCFWHLAKYDGIQLVLDEDDDQKEYTFILRDQAEHEKREDGRDKAGISWEVKFNTKQGSFVSQDTYQKCKQVFFPWHVFKATYRGKEIDHPGALNTNEIRRIGLMMRSYFGKQDGDFSLVIHSISAIQTPLSNPRGWWFPPCIARLWSLVCRKA